MLKNYENVYENVTFTRLNTYKKGNDRNSAIPDIQKFHIFSDYSTIILITAPRFPRIIIPHFLHGI